MIKEILTEFLEAFGWSEKETRSSSMWSFKKEDFHLNYYFTTGTLTVQQEVEGVPYGKMVLNKKNVKNLIQLETILEEIN